MAALTLGRGDTTEYEFSYWSVLTGPVCLLKVLIEYIITADNV